MINDADEFYFEQVSVVCAALNQQLRDNQLVKVKLELGEVDNNHISCMLSKHANSLKEIRMINHIDECSGIACLLENLINYKIALHVLTIRMLDDLIPLLSQYLHSSGMLLKALTVEYHGDSAMSTDQFLELFLLIGTFCPDLEKLTWFTDEESNPNIKPIEIYRLCPNFKCLSLKNFTMRADEDMLDLHISHNVRLEESMECVLLALERGQYSQVGLSVFPNLRDEEWEFVMKPIGSMLTSLEVEVTEDTLINLLSNHLRLQTLEVTVLGTLTDRSLAAIAECGQTLINMTLSSCEYDNFECSDEMIVEMIRKCPKLEKFIFPCVGRDCILCAAQYLPRLKMMRISDIKGRKADIVSLVCGGEVQWSSNLKYGHLGPFIWYSRKSRIWKVTVLGGRMYVS